MTHKIDLEYPGGTILEMTYTYTLARLQADGEERRWIVGCAVVLRNPRTGKTGHIVRQAVCHPKDDFDPKIGRRIAFRRVIEAIADRFLPYLQESEKKDFIRQARRKRWLAEGAKVSVSSVIDQLVDDVKDAQPVAKMINVPNDDGGLAAVVALNVPTNGRRTLDIAEIVNTARRIAEETFREEASK